MINEITMWLLIVTGLVWLIWDIALYLKMYNNPKVSTISVMITKFSWYSPALPFVVGVLMGHWFWPSGV